MSKLYIESIMHGSTMKVNRQVLFHVLDISAKRIMGMLFCCMCSVVTSFLTELVSILVRNTSGSIVNIYRVSQELRSVLQELIPELMLSRKPHLRRGTIRNGSGVISF